MITGTVNDNLEPCLNPSLQSSDGRRARIDAAIDTGFAGSLMVPLNVIRQIRLPFLGTITGVLADESDAEMDRYLGSVSWDGRQRVIEVLAGNGDPLIGTELFRHHSLHIDMVPRGRVIIRPRRGRR
jgi:clan AA aspartic protease